MSKKHQGYVKSTKKKSKFKIILFLFLIGGLIFIFASNTFKVKNIVVTGNHNLSKESIEKKAKVYNKNIFIIRKKTVEKNLIDNEITAADIKKEIPKTLKIDIVENRNIAYVKEDGSKYYYINTDGFIEGNSNEKPEGIPVVYGIGLNLLHDGKSIFQDDNIKMIFDTVEKNEIQITQYDFSNKEDIILKTDKINIFLGNTNELKVKLEVLTNIFNDISTKGINIKEINIKNANKPILVKED